MFSVNATLTNTKLQIWMKNIPFAAQRATIRVAQLAEQRCQETAPIRGGGLRESHYVISDDGKVNEYIEHVKNYEFAYRAEYGSEGKSHPAAEPPPGGAVMGCAAWYGFYQEHGTRYHSPQPWFSAACAYAKAQQGAIFHAEVAQASPFL